MKYLIFLFFFITISCKESEEVKNYRPFVNDYKEELQTIKDYSKEYNYKVDYCILVDMDIPSNYRRLFLIDIKYSHIILEGLVAHGSGCGEKRGKPLGFSNVNGSNCSSLGISKLGDRGWSNIGVNVKYWLEGLENTNNLMQQRVVVLHSYSGIPDTPVREPILMSQGCLTISDRLMYDLDKFIQKQRLNSPSNDILVYVFQ